MAEDFQSINNNYNALDDDVGFATEGYKSKDATCSFFSNKGSCYKGELCEFRHLRPRRGAVTGDLEPVIGRTWELSGVEAAPYSVLVKIVNIISPSSFYIIFPHSRRNILTVREDDRRQSVAAEYRDLFQSLQEDASRKVRVRRSGLESHLAPGTLVVARAGDGNWHRAMVTGDTDLHSNLEIFLVDRGVTVTVGEGDVRILGSQHALLPFQAEEAELGEVEAPGWEDWAPEATQKLKEIIEAADYLSAVVESVLLTGKVVLKLSAVKGEETEDVKEKLCEAGLARSTRKQQTQSSRARLYYPG